MDERENLPIVLTTQAVTVLSKQSNSLVGRGLAVLRQDNAARYRQARAVFDRGDCTKNWNAADNPTNFSAFKIFKKLADEDYGKAYYPLSIFYSGRNDIEDGNSHAQHYTKLALEWCVANQANDDAELWCDLGDMHNFNGSDGYGITQDREIAEFWYRKAAGQGYARGQWELSFFFIFDDQDHPGSYWMELAAKQGNADYQTILAECYEFLSSQYQKAAYWFRMAAEQGDGCGQFNLGRMYEKGLGIDQNDEQFVYWTRKAAEQGYESGQWKLGLMFSEGRGVAQDYVQAEYWFSKAAKQSVSGRQYELGEMYKEGRGVPQDEKQAVYWFIQAAEQGDEDGQYKLGMLCYDARNYEQAMHWYRKAAEDGHFLSQLFLAEMYEDGRGTQDNEQAVFWFRKALETSPDSGDAKGGLERLGVDWKKT
jgi:TPR repeat protein